MEYLDTVMGGDCSVPASAHTMVRVSPSSIGLGGPQIHGIKLPVLAAQTLCGTTGSSPCTVLGFKPY